MSAVVWKLELRAGLNDYDLPQYAELLRVATQHGVPCLWFKCDPALYYKTKRRLLLTGTGHEFEDARLVHVGTMFTDVAGTFVFHVFEAKP